MKNYPWLQKKYFFFVKKYHVNMLHPVILIQSKSGIGIQKLIKAISMWILCLKKNNFLYCKKCLSCKLMKIKKHPDYFFYFNKNKKIGIDNIRYIIDKVHNKSQQGIKKIIHFYDIQNTTEEAISALLKIIENPPKNTIFFIVSKNIENLNLTIRSRCIIYKINSPSEEISLIWLKNKLLEIKNYSEKEIISSLRINNGSPNNTYVFFKKKINLQRNIFLKNLDFFFLKKNYTLLMNNLNENVKSKINWICLIIIDSIKLSLQKNLLLINIDKLHLIKKISKTIDISILYKSLLSWSKCRYILKKKSYIDKEIIISEQILYWINLIKDSLKK